MTLEIHRTLFLLSDLAITIIYIFRKIIRNEIYAHGILDHQNIVRNFSCWKEQGYVYIQNEYCNGGNLENYMTFNDMSETLLRSLLLQMANALR